ncbi:MAG: hypothetical protein ACI8Z5_001069, partial [Lentimonas sp.]
KSEGLKGEKRAEFCGECANFPALKLLTR